MKSLKKIIFLVTIFTFMFNFNFVSANIGSNEIKFNLNYGGDKLGAGSSLSMSWISSDDIDRSKTLMLDLYSESLGYLKNITRNLPLNGSYTWKIGDDIPTASDYKLSVTTNDKGPSAASNWSQRFAITSGGNTYKITDFSAGLSYSGNGHEGSVNLEFATNDRLPSDYFLYLNVGCSQGVEIIATNTKGSANLKCGTWNVVDYSDSSMRIDYKNSSTNSGHISFTLDLYQNNQTVQRKFITDLTIPGYREVVKNLNLNVSPTTVGQNQEMVIRFNDVGATSYSIRAYCGNNNIQMAGKARPDLCTNIEEVFPTGKDVIAIRDFYPYNNTSKSVPVTLEVSAILREKVIQRESVRLNLAPKETVSDFEEQFKKWGDIRFINPQEGQTRPEKIRAGQQYTLKWENIVKAEWTNVELYKYSGTPSSDYLRNGPTNVIIGSRVLDLGKAYLGQESLIVNLPSNLEPGYYYFRFGGKAAGDSSPAIEIIDSMHTPVDPVKPVDNPTNISLSSQQTLDLFGILFGKDSDIYKIVSLLIQLGIIK